VDAADIAPRRAALRASCGFTSDDIVVGCIARFDRDKDLQNLVRAAGLAARSDDRVRFLLIGHRDAAEEAQLRAWMRAAACEDRFVLLSSRTDAPDYLVAMDAYCLSSRNEGFPNVVGEAMSCALPCVVTDVGDAAILVGDAGIVVPKENAPALAEGIVALLRMTPEQRSALGQRALARVCDRFSSRHSRERFESLYRQVMKDGI
jgi:glycosyltransferase involved in cell wall biosynthesis